jgi:hypothetical protein
VLGRAGPVTFRPERAPPAAADESIRQNAPRRRTPGGQESIVWTDTLIMAGCIIVLGALAMLGTDSYKRPVTAVLMYLILPVLAAAGFVTLANLSG